MGIGKLTGSTSFWCDHFGAACFVVALFGVTGFVASPFWSGPFWHIFHENKSKKKFFVRFVPKKSTTKWTSNKTGTAKKGHNKTGCTKVVVP